MVRGDNGASSSPLGSEVAASPGRPTTVGTVSSPCAVRTKVTGRGTLEVMWGVALGML